ncbi:hypothetical protein IGI04_014699 [Brassica rapa subsp. trilocularis]|uniref:NAC domain-containing protein n=1 Tax=Brassica rapa subsp. trilocularis TaxID=1813537 RepID=A0ABQ7MN30_BRACM|nr:hypothetical protein IGI04_014699 [Brassica rapa subsp. trilocularis]
MFWSLFRVFTGSGTFRRNMVILESFGVFGGEELHRRVRCLAMDGDLPAVNQHLVAEVMPVLLKSGQSASREEAAEKRKPRRSMQHSAHRSMEIPDRGPCIFYDCLPFFYAFYTLSFSIVSLRREGRNSYQSSPGTPLVYIYQYQSNEERISRSFKEGACWFMHDLKPKREVSIDTLQAASIDSVSKASNNTIHHVSKNTIHRGTVHPGTVHRNTIYLPSIDTVHIPSIDTVHQNTVHCGTVHPNTVHPNTVHRDTVHRDTVHMNTVHLNTVHHDIVHPNTVHRNTIHRGTILDFVYSEQDEDFEIPTTHVKQPDIQVHHADESKQKDELNKEKLVNHDTAEDDEYHVSEEQSKVEETNTKDLTSASIDSSNSESIDIRTSETIDTYICHRSIPSTIPDATTVYARAGRPKAIRDYNKADTSDPASTSIVIPTSSSIDPSISEMIDTDFCHRSIPLEIPESSSCPQDIANSTQESIDESRCDLTSDVDKVTLKDFLELEEWLRQKLDDKPLREKSPSNIDQHTPDCIARYPPDCIDRHPCLDELSGYMIEPELVGRKQHTSGASHLALPENLRPPLCEEEAVGICKRVKRIHDPVKIMVPCAVFEVESPISPDKGVYLSSYIEVLNDQHHVEAYQRGLRFIDEVDEGPAGIPSSDISRTKLIDINTSSSIDTDQIPSIDTRRESEQNEYELCGNIFYGDTTTHSDKSGGKKWRNWKKKKRINEGSQISLILYFSDDARKSRVRLHKSVGKKGRNWKKRKRTKGGSQLPLTPYFSDSVRKPRVRSRCFSQPFAKLKALLIAEMIDKGEGRLLSTLTDDTSSISIDSTSYPTIDCLFIVSNDCSSHRPMRPCHYQSTTLHQQRSIVTSLYRSILSMFRDV